jgi:hypothetical protein
MSSSYLEKSHWARVFGIVVTNEHVLIREFLLDLEDMTL